jgi:type III secretory pathway component EscS
MALPDSNNGEFTFRGVMIAMFESFASRPSKILSALGTNPEGHHSLGTISLIVANTFALLWNGGSSIVNPALISLLLLFDQATTSLIEQDPGFAVQLLLVQLSLLGSAGVMRGTLASAAGLLWGMAALGGAFLAVYMRYEALPVVLPLVAVLVRDVFGDSRGPFFARLGEMLERVLSLSLIGAGAMALALAALLAFEPPLFDWRGMTVEDVALELSTNRHNVAIFGVSALAGAFWLVSEARIAWVASMLFAAGAVIAQPVGCVINDWLIRTVLARYLLLVGSGLVLSKGTPSWLATPFIAALAPVCAYFYACPVQALPEM